MDHLTLSQNDPHGNSGPEAPTGLEWPQFFQELSQSTLAAEATSQHANPLGIQGSVFYASENGDRWSLVREWETGREFVRHRPNLASGGQTSDVDVGDFLARSGMGPEKRELLRLIGSALEGAEMNP